MKILLVDDVKLDRMQLAIRLKQLGHSVQSVPSGRDALASYELFEPELIILDVMMPEMSGYEVSTFLRAKYKDWVPIIFLSSHDEPEMIAQAINSGGDDYLIKPVEKLVLMSKLLAMQRIADMRRELKTTTAKLEQLNQLLQRQVHEDGLTQVHNRRYMDEKLHEMVSVHGRHHLPLTVILFDVDLFKLFNDNYGHTEGDQCLCTIAQTVNKLFPRAGEYVGRYGGEEFVVFLGHCDQKQAERAANRIQVAIQAINYRHEYSSVEDHITVSQGIVTFFPTGKETLNRVYDMADDALYKSKENGRNCFSFWDGNENIRSKTHR
ncbi:GGDEF domain-containing response regulator [Vibrio salinus]|uniref:GGDEF domain-containing response regulator n=1 Tax=Vibrio salinus TaxID=2899784 RepID=UPI001E5BA36A|nr:diguanylate cyclase [Vibrio salinus]MCE0495383.1 diguanylate cyclase [Vibrio salinus]